jgi:hypothetical protein
VPTDQSPADGGSGTPNILAAPAVPPEASLVSEANGNSASKKPASGRKPASGSQGTSAENAASVAPVLRSNQPPATQLDYDDRHDTRATESDDMARRYADLRKDRRKSDWHYLAMGLVSLVVAVAVYLAGFIVMSHLLPHLTPHEAMQVVGLAFLAAGGGLGALAGVRALARHSWNRGRDLKPE